MFFYLYFNFLLDVKFLKHFEVGYFIKKLDANLAEIKDEKQVQCVVYERLNRGA